MRRAVLFLALAACGGSSDADPTAKPKTTEPPQKLAGVWPEKFDCATVTTEQQVSDALGMKAGYQYSPTEVPNGIARACSYQVTNETGGVEFYTYDFDCRDNYKKSADALFAQYAKDAEAQVQAYNAMSDAKAREPKDKPGKDEHGKPIDAAPPAKPLETSTPVEVGLKGLDHHGRGLIFIDDDAPCYVRIGGLDAAKRLALAQLVAKNLTFANAPMRPRPFP